MSKNLLQKTNRIYLKFTILSLFIIVPLFYGINEKLNLSNADESLILRKYLFSQKALPNLKEANIKSWNNSHFDIKILADKGLKQDSLFFTSYFENLDKEYESYRELNSPILIEKKPYTFSARMNLLASSELMISIALVFITVLLFLFVGFYFLNKRISTKLWKPFYSSLEQIKDYELDKNKKPDFEHTDTEEFIQLNKSVATLIKKNITIYKNQKEFVENAAHELQTPIAVFKAKLETLMQRDDLSEGQAELLLSLNSSIARLTKLNKNLLLLSKIGKPQFEEKSAVSIKTLIEDQLDFFREQCLQKQIKIHTKLDEIESQNVNSDLTEIFLSNLLLNAIQHNRLHGNINIELISNKLTISNTGAEHAIKPESIFQRFSTSSSSPQGNGLGLAIIKKIADNNDWSLTYSYSDAIHTFQIKF